MEHAELESIMSDAKNLEASGDYQNALNQYFRVIWAAGDLARYAEAHLGSARIQYKLDNLVEAGKRLEWYLDLRPDDIEARELYAKIKKELIG